MRLARTARLSTRLARSMDYRIDRQRTCAPSAISGNEVYISPLADGANVTLAQVGEVSDRDRASPAWHRSCDTWISVLCSACSTGRQARRTGPRRTQQRDRKTGNHRPGTAGQSATG